MPCDIVVSCGINTTFAVLSPCLSQVAHALLTRPPLELTVIRPKASVRKSPLDLHVLSTPPAFVLSQDQTLAFNPFILNYRFIPAASSHSFGITVLHFSALFLPCIVFKVRADPLHRVSLSMIARVI